MPALVPAAALVRRPLKRTYRQDRPAPALDAMHAGETYPEHPYAGYGRPKTYGECVAAGWGGRGPCPWVSCAWHLALEVPADTGNLTLNHPGKELWELPDTCTLAVADRGGANLEAVGRALNITGERVKQVIRRIVQEHLGSWAVETLGGR